MTDRPHERGVLDTSAVIRLAEIDPRRLQTESVTTTVTLAELTDDVDATGADVVDLADTSTVS